MTEKMKIACIGWGSLIWRPEGLKIQNHWFEDGPILPIEFTRISNDNRVTLIIDEDAKPVKTLWTLMTCDNLDEAKKSLMDREGILIRNAIRINSVCQKYNLDDKIHLTIKNWLKEKDIDCAIWTGLSFSDKTDRTRPTIQDIIAHLKKIDYRERIAAEEYIRKAPKQIDTEYRRVIEMEFGWKAQNE